MASALSEFLDVDGERMRGDEGVSSSREDDVENQEVGLEDVADGGGDRRYAEKSKAGGR